LKATKFLIITVLAFVGLCLVGQASAATTLIEPFDNLTSWSVVAGNNIIDGGQLKQWATAPSAGGVTSNIRTGYNYNPTNFRLQFKLTPNDWTGSVDQVYRIYLQNSGGGYYGVWIYANGELKIGDTNGFTTCTSTSFTNGNTYEFKFMREGNTLSLYVDGTHMGDRTTAQANLVNARIDTGVTAVRYTSLTAHVDDLYYTDSYVAPVYTGHLLVDVLKASDNSAISGAFASLKYSNGSEVANATSNATGWADIIVPLSVPHAFTDNYNLTVTATGYSPAWQTSPWCYACYNTTYTTTAMMTSGAASLYGYAFDMTDGSTLGGTLVSVYYPNETIMATDTTDSNGYYLVDIPTNGPSGLYKVTGLHTGFATYEVSVNYPTSWGGNTGFERDLYLDMEVPTGYAQLSISVVDGYGVGISGATVEIFQDNFSTMPRSYVTNSVGSVVALVPLDTWQVKANNGAGYTIASGEIVADSELVYSLVLKLSPRVIPTATPYPSGTFILTPSTTEVNMSTLVSFTISLSGYSWDDIGGVAWFEDGIFYKSYFWDASQNCWMEK
jgi:hypothetical protein